MIKGAETKSAAAGGGARAAAGGGTHVIQLQVGGTQFGEAVVEWGLKGHEFNLVT